MGCCMFCVAGRWKPCSDAHQECWLLERQTAPPQKQGWPARRGYGRLSVPEMHSQVWCCWVGRYPGQAARGMGAMENPWRARQGLGIPVEAQPPVSFSGPLILYTCHSPVLAQKIGLFLMEQKRFSMCQECCIRVFGKMSSKPHWLCWSALCLILRDQGKLNKTLSFTCTK